MVFASLFGEDRGKRRRRKPTLLRLIHQRVAFHVAVERLCLKLEPWVLVAIQMRPLVWSNFVLDVHRILRVCDLFLPLVRQSGIWTKALHTNRLEVSGFFPIELLVPILSETELIDGCV